MNYQQQYTELLNREEKAEAWLDDPKRTEAEKEKHIVSFNEILEKLSRMITKHKIASKFILGGWRNDTRTES